VTPYYQDNLATLHHRDCLDALAEMPENSVDTCITDPPYELGFMGKAWDSTGVAFRPETWAAVLRVCKPGAMLLAFGGSRTFHRLTCAIEDAGWEIRDCMSWLYGSGFPKSLDISKAIDKGEDYKIQSAVRRAAVEAVESAGLKLPNNSRWDWTTGEHAPGNKWWAEFKAWIPNLSDEQRQRVEGEIVARVRKAAGWFTNRDIYTVHAPATDVARLWSGWGTALKPAWEPIIVAMKPLDGTYAENAQRHGVAGLNIDGGRIGTSDNLNGGTYSAGGRAVPLPGDTRTGAALGMFRPAAKPSRGFQQPAGRWPANVLLDEVAAELLDEATSELKGGASINRNRTEKTNSVYGKYGVVTEDVCYGDSGGASRFYYTAKASKSDRGHGNNHPTVKPTDLLKYLCTLTATPTGGVVLDPFCGSGTTLVAARECGRPCIGIEMEEAHCRIIVDRLRQGVLFGAEQGAA
jgi:DNA modification methylase